MRHARIVVFMMALVLAGASVGEAPSFRREGGGLPSVEGRGIGDFLACGGCMGSGVVAAAMGWGGFWAAAMGADDGALGAACLDACLSAF